MIVNNETIIFDFDENSNINSWQITNDDVMGGVSNSIIKLDEDGNGVFTGNVSTENNGGFSMVRLPLNTVLLNGSQKIILEIKGDGKEYQFRLKSNRSDQYWYIHSFQTSTIFETIEISLKDFYPSYRGRKLNLDNFASNTVEEIAFLIGNKKDEAFKVIIKKICIK